MTAAAAAAAADADVTGPEIAGAPGAAGSAADLDAASVALGLIWAQSSDGTIGRGGVMPWHLPEDLAHFKQVTLGAPVVMGRKTWDSLPPRFRPLAGRRNIVVTRQADWAAEGAEVAHTVESAVALAASSAPVPSPDATVLDAPAPVETDAPDAVTLQVTDAAPKRIWIIGGAELFAAVIDEADLLEVTEIDAAFEGDTQAPHLDASWSVAATDPADAEPVAWHTSRAGLQYRFITYARP